MCFPMERAVEKKWDYKGLQCIVTRADVHDPTHYSAHRCGYVRVPPNHPWHGKNEDEIDVFVHGGLTFLQEEPCVHEDGIGYWIGFDCHHAGDAGLPAGDPREIKYPRFSMGYEHYWTLSEVQRETELLAEQVLQLS